MQNTEPLDYSMPPLIEVVFGINFKTIEGFKAPHYGLFWNSIKEAYPDCEHASPLAPIQRPDASNLILNELPLPRIWFIGRDRTRLIQLQNDRILFNWRKTSDDAEYPRYSQLFSEFQALFDKFLSFLDENNFEELDITSLNLSYINHILSSNNEFKQSLFFKNINDQHGEGFLAHLKMSNWQNVYALDDMNSQLVAICQQGKHKKTESSLYQLELKVESLDASSDDTASDLIQWFDKSHAIIISTFDQITTEEAQEDWGKK